MAAALFHFRSRILENAQAESHLFLECWLGALGIAAVGNIYFLRADAHRRGEKFVSAGMRAALRALWPSYLVAAVVTILSWRFPGILPIPWMLLYGLGLLGTQHFAPRSIALLGWAFLMAGLLALIGLIQSLGSLGNEHSLLIGGNLTMGVTFGVFHLIYAACAWPRKRGEAGAGNAP